MLKSGMKLIGAFLAIVLLAGIFSASRASNAELNGHWAEEPLRKALADGYIAGDGALLRPDAPITVCEAAAIVCRALGAVKSADVTGASELAPGDWFYDDAPKAAALGLITGRESRSELSAYLSRGQALAMLAEAFQLVPAEPGLSALSGYPDAAGLGDVLAALVSGGSISGDGGALQPDGEMTRAEFLTVLYRIKESPGSLFFGDGAADVDLSGVSADTVVIRSGGLKSVTLASCDIKRLVLAQLDGDIVVPSERSAVLGTIAVGTGAGAVTLEHEAAAVEITGDGRQVTLTAPAAEVVVGGSRNTVVISPGAAVGALRVLRTGTGNTITVGGTVKNIDIAGDDTEICGDGRAETVCVRASGDSIGVACDALVTSKGGGLDGLALSMTAPDILPAGAALEAVAYINSDSEKVCRASWYIDGILVERSDITLTGGTETAVCHTIRYSRELPASAELRFVLSTSSGGGAYRDIGIVRSVTLENYPPEYYDTLERPFPLDKEETQAEIGRLSESHGAAGVQVAVIYNGAVAGTYTYGSATAGEQPMTDDMKIRVASVSKVVMGMVAMSLKEENVVELDADIGDYLGGAVRNPNYKDIPITLRMLMTHTSSLRLYEDGDIGTSGSAICGNLKSGACFTQLEPGTIDAWGYNNYGFAALGVILEKASGETVNSVAGRNLFEPLGIDASFGGGNLDASEIATLYYADGSVARSVASQMHNTGSGYPGQTGAFCAGGLTISAADLGKLVAVLANDGSCVQTAVLSPDSVREMEAYPQQKAPGQLFYQAMPLRYQTDIYGQEALYYHTGSAYGVYSLISYNPATKNGVVVLTTGADGGKDSYGIYSVCGGICDYIYGRLGS